MVVLTFTLNSDESESESIIDYTTLQFNLPADIYFCGILHIGECEEVNPDVFKVIDDKNIYIWYVTYTYINII